MDAIKGLKYALVMVLVTSAVLLGWTTYLERQLHQKQVAFSNAVIAAKSSEEAKQVIQAFLEDTEVRSKANSASADDSCFWLCSKE